MPLYDTSARFNTSVWFEITSFLLMPQSIRTFRARTMLVPTYLRRIFFPHALSPKAPADATREVICCSHFIAASTSIQSTDLMHSATPSIVLAALGCWTLGGTPGSQVGTADSPTPCDRMERVYSRIDLYGLARASETRTEVANAGELHELIQAWSRHLWISQGHHCTPLTELWKSLYSTMMRNTKSLFRVFPSFILVQKQHCKRQTAVSVVGWMQHLMFTLVRKPKDQRKLSSANGSLGDR